MSYKTPNQVMGINVIPLKEALEYAWAEHALDWFESGAAYEMDSGEYESPGSDWEALDWAYGGLKWDVFPLYSGLGTEGATEAVGESLRESRDMGVKWLFLASEEEIGRLVMDYPVLEQA